MGIAYLWKRHDMRYRHSAECGDNKRVSTLRKTGNGPSLRCHRDRAIRDGEQDYSGTTSRYTEYRSYVSKNGLSCRSPIWKRSLLGSPSID